MGDICLLKCEYYAMTPSHLNVVLCSLIVLHMRMPRALFYQKKWRWEIGKILSIQKTLVDENDISLCVIKAWGGQKRVLLKLLVGVLARLIMANLSLRKW